MRRGGSVFIIGGNCAGRLNETDLTRVGIYVSDDFFFVHRENDYNIFIAHRRIYCDENDKA